MIRTGDTITIYCADSYADGVVASICHVDNLPTLPGFEMAEVREALQDGMFTHLAMLEYKFLDETRGIAALLDSRGRWWDLQGKTLIIEKRGRGTAYDHRAFGRRAMG
jgi:hypothetical protein